MTKYSKAAAAQRARTKAVNAVLKIDYPCVPSEVYAARHRMERVAEGLSPEANPTHGFGRLAVKNQELSEENARLTEILKNHGINVNETGSENGSPDHRSEFLTVQ